MPLDENVQAEMYQARMFLPSNNLFMRLLFRFIYMTAVLFILSDYVSDFYVAGKCFRLQMIYHILYNICPLISQINEIIGKYIRQNCNSATIFDELPIFLLTNCRTVLKTDGNLSKFDARILGTLFEYY